MRRRAWMLLGAVLLGGCVRVDWTSAEDWDRFVQMAVSNPLNAVATSVGASGDVETGRVTETGGEFNDRRWWLLDGLDATDSEVRALWWDHTPWAGGGGQMGQVHRAQVLPDGTRVAYVVWHDYLFGQEQVLHGAVWFRDPDGTFHYDWIGSASLDALLDPFAVTASSRAGGTVTLTVASGHGVQAGDTIWVDVADASYDTTAATVTSAGPTTVAYAQAGPDDASGGAGSGRDLDRVMPYWVVSRLVGDTLSVKAWPHGEPEPAWSDPDHVRTWVDTAGSGPTAPGATGVYAGHIEGGDWVEYGEITARSLDPDDGSGGSPQFGEAGGGDDGGLVRVPVPVPSVPTPADRAARDLLTGRTDLDPLVPGTLP